MEVEDGAYPLLDNIKISTNIRDAFTDSDVGICIGGYPHHPGMERSDLLSKNAEIFEEIGSNLNTVASKNCKIVVVANPVNSITTLLANYANKLSPYNFTALSRLDHNRAKYLIAKKCNTTVDNVKKVIVWGNHSDTQYPDTFNCTINGKPILEHLKNEEDWLHEGYVDAVSQRWKRIVDHMGTTR